MGDNVEAAETLGGNEAIPYVQGVTFHRVAKRNRFLKGVKIKIYP
jgi:hypothetical protein